MEKGPFSTLRASGWTSNGMRIGGAIVHGITSSGPLIFSCVCLFLAYKKREKPSKLLERSLSLAALHGGKVTLNNIILASAEVRHDSSYVNLALDEFKRLLNSDPLHFTKLQKVATKLEMTGQEDKAVKILENAYNEAIKKGKSQEAYELEMFLVEMLIYQGHFTEALGKSCLKEEEMSDVRRPLYKAVIHILSENIEQAKEAYDEFLNMQSNFLYGMDLPFVKVIKHSLQSPIDDIEHNFGEFKKVVSNLKKEIKHAQENKSQTEIPLP